MQELTKDLLLELMVECEACEESFDYVNSQETIEDVIAFAGYHYTFFFLSNYPEYSYLLPKGLDWYKSNRFILTDLLIKQPQFAAKCDFSILNGYNIASLLSKQPQLSTYCDLDKLEGINWRVLLTNQPQFAVYCPWSKLDSQDKSRLREEQPQLFVKHAKKH